MTISEKLCRLHKLALLHYPPYSYFHFPVEKRRVSANYDIILERQMILINAHSRRHNQYSEHFTKFQIYHKKNAKYTYHFTMGTFFVQPDIFTPNWWLDPNNEKFMYRFSAFYRNKDKSYEYTASSVRFEEDISFEGYYNQKTPEWKRKPIKLDKLISIIDYVILLMT